MKPKYGKKEWEEVLSEDVAFLIDKYGHKEITPSVFKESVAEVLTLPIGLQVEFILFQIIMKEGN